MILFLERYLVYIPMKKGNIVVLDWLVLVKNITNKRPT